MNFEVSSCLLLSSPITGGGGERDRDSETRSHGSRHAGDDACGQRGEVRGGGGAMEAKAEEMMPADKHCAVFAALRAVRRVCPRRAAFVRGVGVCADAAEYTGSV